MNKDENPDRALKMVRQEGPVTGHRKERDKKLDRWAWLFAASCISLIMWVLVYTALDLVGWL